MASLPSQHSAITLISGSLPSSRQRRRRAIASSSTTTVRRRSSAGIAVLLVVRDADMDAESFASRRQFEAAPVGIHSFQSLAGVSQPDAFIHWRGCGRSAEVFHFEQKVVVLTKR